MVNESLNTYTNVSGKTQSVYTDWGNAIDVADDGTIELYESIGDALVSAGLFTLTTEDTGTPVSERDPDEVDDALDSLEGSMGSGATVGELETDLDAVIVSLIADETKIGVLNAYCTTDGITNVLVNFGTLPTQIGGKDIIWDGSNGHTYKILLTDGTISISQVT